MCDKINKIAVYRFVKNKDEKEQWIKSVPNANLNVTNNTVICQQHWPSNFDTIEVHGKIRPKIHHLYGLVCQVVKYEHPQLFKECQINLLYC